MINMIGKIMQETMKSGIGQAIIAFGAWGYVFILILIAVYYLFLCIIKSITHKRS